MRQVATRPQAAGRVAAAAVRARRRLWTDRPLRTKGLAVIALPMLVLFVALAAVLHTVRQEEAAEDAVKRTLGVQGSLQALEAAIYRAALQASQRDPDAALAAPPQDAALQDVPRILAQLEQAITDQDERVRLRTLDAAARELAMRLPQGSAYSREGAALPALAGFTAALEAMREQEAQRLVARSGAAEQARQQNLLIVAGAIAAGLGGSVAAMLLFSTGIVRRVADAARRARQLIPGAASEVPGPADEIGQLATALNVAVSLLEQRQQRLEDLVSRLITVQEEERRRVAYQLHDGLAQVAAAAHQHLQAYAERYPPQLPAAQAALERGIYLVQRAVRETRGAIAGLRPTALDDFGLAAALRVEIDALRRDGWLVAFDDGLGDKRLAGVVETALFRIAQEVFANIRKHAGREASVGVVLEHTGQCVRLTIRDDGAGFDPDAPANGSGGQPGEHVGLGIIRERAALVGAAVTIRSAPGAGTRVRVEVPPPPAQPPAVPAA